MKKTEHLELENQVLRNIIACVKEELEIERNPYEKLGSISAIIDFDKKMKYAIMTGYSIDFRRKKDNEPAGGNRTGSNA